MENGGWRREKEGGRREEGGVKRKKKEGEEGRGRKNYRISIKMI